MLEVIRIVADWLGHPTYGVNALLPQVGLDPGDTAPPAVVAILDETRDGRTAVDLPPDPETAADQYPALLIRALRPTDVAPSQVQLVALGDCSLLIQYAGLATDSQVGATAMYRTLYRAVPKSLAYLLQTSAGEAARRRHDVQITGLEAITHLDKFASVETRYLAGALVPRFQVRDAWTPVP